MYLHLLLPYLHVNLYGQEMGQEEADLQKGAGLTAAVPTKSQPSFWAFISQHGLTSNISGTGLNHVSRDLPIEQKKIFLL